MYLVSRAGPMAACALGAAILATAALGVGLSKPAAPARTTASVTVTPGVRDLDQRPSTTSQCRRSLQIACYNPLQLQRAYHLPALYARGITGRGATIVIVDPYGSPTIATDLRTFDRTEGIADPPSLRVIRPAGQVPSYDAANSGMVAWASETTLDVEYAHAVAPGAKILLVETPGSGKTGTVDMAQIVTAENYVVQHHLGDVISQSFVATEQAVGAAGIQALRGAYQAAYRDHVTVLAGAGDNGATGFEPSQKSYFSHAVTSWPASDPLVTGVGGTRLDLDASGGRRSADTVWNDTYSKTANRLVDGTPGPNPLAGGGGKSVIFARPAYQDAVSGVTGAHRGVPDISMSAACTGAVNAYQSFGGQAPGWYVLCGTSEATPLFAGVVALADQMAGHSLGLINPALYRLAAAHAPGIVGVTTGDNSVSFTKGGRTQVVTGYRAQAGYSLAAGLGTIDAQYFVPELAAAG